MIIMGMSVFDDVVEEDAESFSGIEGEWVEAFALDMLLLDIAYDTMSELRS